MNGSEKLHLAGVIVETIERDGRRLAKIRLKQCTIEVDAEVLMESHLGDTITIEADILVRTVKPAPGL
jgi:hypothetical protein